MTVVDVDHDAVMIRHATRRGAVNTPHGVGTLVGWPASRTPRCLVQVGDPAKPGHVRPLKTETTPIMCGICDLAADQICVTAGYRLCVDCARDEAAAST